MNILSGLVLNWIMFTQYLYVDPNFYVHLVSQDYLKRKTGSSYVVAIYERSNIYLSDKALKKDSVYLNSILVHELIHHYQHSSGLMDTYGCIQESEKLAYKIQKKYFRYHFYPEENTKQFFSPLGLLFKTTCYSEMNI